MGDLLKRVFDEGFADLLVVDPDGCRVRGLVSNVETTTTFSSVISKKKWEEFAEAQAACHAQCEEGCAQRGGCLSHALVGRSGPVRLRGTVQRHRRTLARGRDQHHATPLTISRRLPPT
jgi:hypothetical protein